MEPNERSIPGDQESNSANIDDHIPLSDQSICEDSEVDEWQEANSNDDWDELYTKTPSDVVPTENTQQEDLQRLANALQLLEQPNLRGLDDENYFPGLEPDSAFLHRDGGANTMPSPSFRTVSTANISFYIRLAPLTPNYQSQPARHGAHGFWVPPNIMTGYTRGPDYTFRWMNGDITHVGSNDPIGRSLHQTYSAATVFTQYPNTPRLLVVPFDAQRRNVIDSPGGWRPLAFHHIPIDDTQRTYSALSANGDRQYIAVPGPTHWMPQLLPPIYNYQGGGGKARIQAGLIGSLPLLIALAAFSAPPSVLLGVLTNCVQPMVWRRHQFEYPTGRKCHSTHQ